MIYKVVLSERGHSVYGLGLGLATGEEKMYRPSSESNEGSSKCVKSKRGREQGYGADILVASLLN